MSAEDHVTQPLGRQRLSPAPAAKRLAPGDRLGECEILGVLGEGAAGVVYEARQPALDRRVAVKQLKPCADPQALERLRREARALAQLELPGLVRIYEVGADADRRPFLVLEYVDGTTLRQRLAGPPALTQAEGIELLIQVAGTLAELHRRGVAHRDVKPENVLVDRDGRARLSDLGLVQLSPDPTLTEHGQVMGTPAYLPPEALKGHCDGATRDVYAVGVMVFELLTGRQPYRGRGVAELLAQVRSGRPSRAAHLRPALPHPLAHLANQAVARDPKRRFADMPALLAALRAVRPELARPTRVSAATQLWRRLPRPGLQALLAAGLLCLAAVLGVGLGGPSAPAPTQPAPPAPTPPAPDLAPLQAALTEALAAGQLADARGVLSQLETAGADTRATALPRALLDVLEPVAAALDGADAEALRQAAHRLDAGPEAARPLLLPLLKTRPDRLAALTGDAPAAVGRLLERAGLLALAPPRRDDWRALLAGLPAADRLLLLLLPIADRPPADAERWAAALFHLTQIPRARDLKAAIAAIDARLGPDAYRRRGRAMAIRYTGEARRRHAAGDPDAARDRLRLALRLWPALGAAWFLDGQIALAEGEPQAAVKAFRRAEALGVRDPALLRDRSRAHYALEAYEHAEAVARRGLAMARDEPTRRTLHRRLARALMKRGQLVAARDHAAAAASGAPDASTLAVQARIACRANRVAEARGLLASAREAGLRGFELDLARAELAQQQAAWAEVLRASRAVIASAPPFDLVEARAYHIGALYQLGRRDEARRALQRAIAAHGQRRQLAYLARLLRR